MRATTVFSVLMLSCLLLAPIVSASEPAEPVWLHDYAEAMDTAERQGKMMFILFCTPGKSEQCDCLQSKTLSDEAVREKLEQYVCVRLSKDATIIVDGKKVTLLESPAFAEMRNRQGMVMIDFRDRKSPHYGDVVSTFPLLAGHEYTPERMRVILDLPSGTLTQRTLIYAVRTQPDRPASTEGKLSADLSEEAEMHSTYQARIRLQGHHHWGSRFRRIIGRLRGGMTASEVCAESWPGEDLVPAAIECVRCWRFSSGHWSQVRARHHYYGYDMKRGSNGIWYATGIFGGR